MEHSQIERSAERAGRASSHRRADDAGRLSRRTIVRGASLALLAGIVAGAWIVGGSDAATSGNNPANHTPRPANVKVVSTTSSTGSKQPASTKSVTHRSR